jgi:hypothetical protein
VGQEWAVSGLEELLDSHFIVVLNRDGPAGGGGSDRRWVTSRRGAVTQVQIQNCPSFE